MDQKEEVKLKSDIVSIIGERIELKKAGRNFKASCPFHGEKTASFIVSPELQIFKCFGCGEGGDVFTFLEKYEGMDFSEALKYLADRVGIKLISFKKENNEKDTLLEINSLTAKFYNYILLSHPLGKPALDYLVENRGIKKEVIEEFKLGFSPANPSVLNKFLIEKKKFHPQDIEKAGIGFSRNGFVSDRFRGRVTFPLLDHRGNVVGFSGRSMPGAPSDFAKYINSPETEIYHKSQLLYGLNLSREFIKRKGVAIVVEGEFDLLSPWQMGIKNIVAIKGSSLTEEQVKLLSRFAKKIILALDADFAGGEAAKRGIKIAADEGLEIKVTKFKDYKDPDEFASEDPEGFKKALIASVSIWDFLIDSVFNKYDQSGSSKAKISREVTPILASIEDKIVQAHYIGLVARKLNVPEEAVIAQIENKPQLFKEQASSTVPKLQEKNRRVLLEERLMSLSFQSVPKLLLGERARELIVTPLTKRILDEYISFSKKKGENFTPNDFSAYLPKELVNGFTDMLLAGNAEDSEDEEVVKREINLVFLELEVLEIRRSLEELGAKIRKYEDEESGEEKLKQAQIKFGELSKKLSMLEEGPKKGIILH